MNSVGGYHAVVLAAGFGSRFGGSKLTAAYNGNLLLNAVLQTACAAPVKSVVVVTGAHRAAVQSAVVAFARNTERSIRSVYCADYTSGMFASLRWGLASIPKNAAGTFIFLGDMPSISNAVASKLLVPVLAGALAAVPSVDGSWGHPVLITRSLFRSFSGSAGDGGGRALLRGLGDALAVVEVNDNGIFADVDIRAEFDAVWRGTPVGNCATNVPEAESCV